MAGSTEANGAVTVLSTLAAHNEWANGLVFRACSDVDPVRLASGGDGYASVIEILQHLVQVEFSFFELAHGRAPRPIELDSLDALRGECARLDRAYRDYVDSLDPERADAEGFVVPWFGFEVTRTEGVLQPLTHSLKHRSDVSMLLPGLGGAGVEMDLIQWFDETRRAR